MIGEAEFQIWPTFESREMREFSMVLKKTEKEVQGNIVSEVFTIQYIFTIQYMFVIIATVQCNGGSSTESEV